MNIVYRFRLTKLLYDQVRFSRQEIGAALRTWEDREYKQLCDYVSQCRTVVPKYVQRLADLMGVEARDVIADIMHGRTLAPEGAGSDGARDFGGVYLPEDSSDRMLYLDQITGGGASRRLM